MELLSLAPEGLFPIASGGREARSSIGLGVSGTLQGEGTLVGVPSLFLRLAGCNLRCQWALGGGQMVPCDTPTAQDVSQGHFVSVRKIVEDIVHYRGAVRHLVVSGGEPLLQRDGLQSLLERLRMASYGSPMHVTIESNGTIFSAEVSKLVDLMSISPKLMQRVAPGHQVEQTEYLGTLQHWIDARQKEGALQLKFVVTSRGDGAKIRRVYLSRLTEWRPGMVCVMPAGASAEQLAETTPAAVEIAIRNGWRFSPRVHIALWGNRPGS